MINFVLITNPETRRIQLFQQAIARFNLPPAQLITYEDLLTEKRSLAEYNTPNTWIRFDSPERNFTVDRHFIAAGATAPDPIAQNRISPIVAQNLEFDKGRIFYPRQWYLGWKHCLQTWQLPGTPLNHPNDIIKMFDKTICQTILENANIPIPRSLTRHTPILNYEQLRDRMEQENCERVFIKLANGSSASGVIAYERQGQHERAITTVERVTEQGELRFYNSRKIRQYRDRAEIADIINFVTAEVAQVEAWLPKARLEGREFDIRVVVIGGKARQAVVRLGNSPMTNLHLGSDRRNITDLPKALSADTWAEMQHTCERAAACFPNSLYCGIDLLISPNFRDHAILEVNAFGDLLQGITWQGQDTYTTEIATLLAQQGIAAEAIC
jgi:glutathione synthase/RimK-type ligase-like ATP-grasp enzyme